jgi:uncharacterized MAPEG superfamily protein
MNVELCYLAMSAALCVLMAFPYVIARVMSWGITDLVGYPENPAPVPAWSGRLKRAHSNMVENLVPFACLILVTQVASISTPMTVFGAALFFWCRTAHALFYTLKVPWFRTIAHSGGVVAMVLLFVGACQ